MAKLVDPLDLPALSKYIHPSNPHQEPFAVAVGLFGLDCEHDCRSEFHPVYALAIQLDENPTSNTWAIFVRNWGDEGFCSSLNHEISFTDEKVKLLFPWPGTKGLKAELQQISPGVVTPVVGLLQDDHGNGEGALVTFALPKPSEQGLIEALLHLEWNGGTAIPAHDVAAGPSIAETAPHPQGEGEQDAEQRLGSLKRQAGVSRPRRSTLAVAPASQPQKLKVQLYRRPSRTASRAPGTLGESLSTPVECGAPASAKPCPIDGAKRNRDIELWKKICAGLKGNYSDQRIADNCAKVEALP